MADEARDYTPEELEVLRRQLRDGHAAAEIAVKKRGYVMDPRIVEAIKAGTMRP